MKINRNNYESFFLDCHEGNMSDDRKKELFDFLKANPDLQNEFDDFEIVSLDSHDLKKFPGKDSLKKKAITAYNYKTWLVAYVENDLGPDEREEAEQFIEMNPAIQKELESFRLTRILPDYQIFFKNKSTLKKGAILIPMWVRIAAAACVAVGIISFLTIDRKENNSVALLPPVESITDVSPVKEKNVNAEVRKDSPRILKNGVAAKSRVKASGRTLSKTKQAPLKINSGTLAEEIKPVNDPSVLNEIAAITPVQERGDHTSIIINENQKLTEALTDSAKRKYVVLDENDLAELGLKNIQTEEGNSGIKSSAASVGKLLGLNTHYSVEQNILQNKSTETFALGPLEITRTLPR